MIFAEPRKHSNAAPVTSQRVFTTRAADQAIHRLRARHGHLTLHHDDGEFGTVSHHHPKRPLHAGRHEACIGIACGAPFYVDYERNAALGYPDYEVDVAAPGAGADSQAEPRLVGRALPRSQPAR